METSIDIEAEAYVRSLANAILSPRTGECLPCYIDRVIRDTGCDSTLRLARRYRDEHAPRATALEKRLESAGGFCDCEVLYNVYWSISDDVLPCRGVRAGSTQPCALWHRHRRGDPWF